MNERNIFIDSLAIEDPGDREAFLDQACEHDQELRSRVERLLQAHRQAESFMEGSADDDLITRSLNDAPETEAVGSRIGPYKLLDVIGEGGMGKVYMAEQTEPVHRRVAIKLIKTGMDTRQVIARFEAERQTLALMDHPNIAKVLDAGATDSGRPYFVMELVKGKPITEFCDQQRLDTESRLKLFQKVCHAVQHAHQKGIIHRDLKPNNVLVAMYDDQPVPKVIDFGVAKATGEKLTEKTMFTRFGQIIGTLEYMSPEQAQFNNLDIDTRSDIYSLGAILYELLAGEPPFERERMKSQALDETLKMIREEEPTRPSTRLSSIRQAARSAAYRQSTPEKLGSMLKGDLDWIVMKSLEKDRVRRYSSATELESDIDRYLSNLPVLARPPSWSYRFGKFARRNAAVLATGLIIALTLITATVISSWQAVNARVAESTAKNALEDSIAVQDFWRKDILGQSNLIAKRKDVLLTEVLDEASEKIESRFARRPLVEARIRVTMSEIFYYRSEHVQGLNQAGEAIKKLTPVVGLDHPLALEARLWQAAHKTMSDPQSAIADLKEIRTECESALGKFNDVTMVSIAALAAAYVVNEQPELAAPLYKLLSVHGTERRMAIKGLHNLGVCQFRMGLRDEASNTIEQAFRLSQNELGPDSDVSLLCTSSWAIELYETGQQIEAIEMMQDLHERQKKLMGEDVRETIITGINLAQMLLTAGKPDEALALAERQAELMVQSSAHFEFFERTNREILDKAPELIKEKEF